MSPRPLRRRYLPPPRRAPTAQTSTSADTVHKTRPTGSQARPGRSRASFLTHRQPGQASLPPQQPTPYPSLASPSPPSVAASSPWAAPTPPMLPRTGRGLLALRLVQDANAHRPSRAGSLGKPHLHHSSSHHASASPRHRLPRLPPSSRAGAPSPTTATLQAAACGVSCWFRRLTHARIHASTASTVPPPSPPQRT